MCTVKRQRLHLARLEQVGAAATTARRYCGARHEDRSPHILGYDAALRARRVRDVRRPRRSARCTSTIVKLETDDGLAGYGETCPLGSTYLPAHAAGARAAIAEVAPALIGVDPRNLNAVWEALDGALAGHDYAKAAIDIACWDLLGKAANLPVSTLLGGATSEDFPLYVAIPLGPVDVDGRARRAPTAPRASGASSSSSAPTRARTRPACARCSTPPTRARRSSPTPTAAGACRTRRSPRARSRAWTACCSSSRARRSRSA